MVQGYGDLEFILECILGTELKNYLIGGKNQSSIDKVAGHDPVNLILWQF